MSREELDLATGPDDAVSTNRPKISLPGPSLQNHICQNKIVKMTFVETKFSQITNVKS
jgi:hypothetical protein